MNRVVLVGRITKDPELRKSPSGVSFCSFSVAVQRAVPNQQGERVADFINCVVFNKQAENLVRFIRKGGMIGIEGKLQSRSYQDQQGQNRTTFDVVCDNISFLESRNQNQQPSYNGGYQQNDYGYGQYNNNQYNQPQSQYPGNNYSRPQPTMNSGNQMGYEPVQQSPFQQEEPQVEQEDSSQNDEEKDYEFTMDDLPF